MAKKKLIKAGDRTITVTGYGEIGEIKNRIPSEEAQFAMGLIDRWGMVSGNSKDGPALPPGAVVDRAFSIARLTFQHIKEYRMDTPFPFVKVFGDAEKND